MKKTQFAKQATHIQQIFLAHVSWALRSECGWPPLVTGHFVDHLLLLYNPDPPLVLLDQALSKIICTILLWGEAERTIRSCNQYVWQWLETSWNIRMLRLKSATKQNAKKKHSRGSSGYRTDPKRSEECLPGKANSCLCIYLYGSGHVWAYLSVLVQLQKDNESCFSFAIPVCKYKYKYTHVHDWLPFLGRLPCKEWNPQKVFSNPSILLRAPS